MRPDIVNGAQPRQVDKRVVLLASTLTAWVLALMNTSINIALPAIQKEFSLGSVALGWLPLAYLLSTGAFLVPFGKIGDLYGRKRIYTWGCLVFALASIACIFVRSYPVFIVFRVGQGLGAAMAFATYTAIITAVYPANERGRALGLNVAAVYVGQALGPTVGGVITDDFGWRGIFVLVAGVGVANYALTAWLLRGAEWKVPARGRFDSGGSVIYVLALAAFLFGLSWLPQTAGIVVIVAGAAGLALFIWWETRVKEPVMDVGLFRHNRVFALSNFAALSNYAGAWAMTFLMSLYLQFIKGLGPGKAGLILIVGVIVQAAFSPLAGRLSDRVDPRWVASGGMSLCAAGLLSLAFLRAESGYAHIVAALCLLGLGFAFFSSPNTNTIMGSVEKRYLGVASATFSTMRMIGQSLSIAIVTLVISVVVGRHEIRPADYPHFLVALRVSFAILTVLSLLAVAASLARGRAREGAPSPAST